MDQERENKKKTYQEKNQGSGTYYYYQTPSSTEDFLEDHPEGEKITGKNQGEEPRDQTDTLKNKPTKTSKGKVGFLGVLLGAILGGALVFGGGVYLLPDFIDRAMPDMREESPSISVEEGLDLNIYSAVAEQAMPSVVGITTVTLERDLFFGDLRERPGPGTGVIVDERGYILTNSHVIGDGEVTELMVLLHDGEELPAEVLWNEASLDLAIIKVDEENLPTANLGDSDDLLVGEITIAIGNPMGLDFERTLTQGVVSGLNRSIPTTGGSAEGIDNFIQTDASINPGNSGGPLLNTDAEVIGINTAKLQNGEGLGFAIPINTAKPIIEQFAETGEFQPVYLGVQGLNAEVYQRSWGEELPVDHGFYVAEVNLGSVAEEYDIESGDVIVGVNGQEVRNRGTLIRELYKLTPGDRAIITIVRGEEEIDIEVVF